MLKVFYRTLKVTLFNKYLTIGLVCVGIFIAGVFSNSKVFAPDLHRLYMETMEVEDQPPVIFIHGVLGSKLKSNENDNDLWPGGALRLFLHDYADIAYDLDEATLQPLMNDVDAYEISDSSLGKDFYGKIIHTLHDSGGYNLATVGQKVDPKQKNYYVFVYDWRQDNVKSAGELADFIEQVRLDYENPDLKVDIVAHSMGGLITRYYLRYGKQDVVNDNHFDKKMTMYGSKRVRRTVLLGTPNFGSVKTLNLFINGVELGINPIETETLASMPSLYQLFPHSLNNWIVTSDGESLDRDVFSVKTWRRFQWSIFSPAARERISKKFDTPEEAAEHLKVFEKYFEHHLERARRFVWSLSIALPKDHEHPKLTVFGGGCILTPARILVEEVNGESLIRMEAKEITSPVAGVDYDKLLFEPGDGSVTKASLLGRNVLDPSVKRNKNIFLPLKQSFFLCVSHNSLTANLNFQDNLLNTLLSRDEL